MVRVGGGSLHLRWCGALARCGGGVRWRGEIATGRKKVYTIVAKKGAPAALAHGRPRTSGGRRHAFLSCPSPRALGAAPVFAADTCIPHLSALAVQHGALFHGSPGRLPLLAASTGQEGGRPSSWRAHGGAGAAAVHAPHKARRGRAIGSAAASPPPVVVATPSPGPSVNCSDHRRKKSSRSGESVPPTRGGGGGGGASRVNRRWSRGHARPQRPKIIPHAAGSHPSTGQASRGGTPSSRAPAQPRAQGAAPWAQKKKNDKRRSSRPPPRRHTAMPARTGQSPPHSPQGTRQAPMPRQPATVSPTRRDFDRRMLAPVARPLPPPRPAPVSVAAWWPAAAAATRRPGRRGR